MLKNLLTNRVPRMLNLVLNIVAVPVKLGSLVLASGLLLAACGGGSAAPATQASGYPGNALACDANGERAWLRDYMNDAYFWYQTQGVPNAAAGTMAQYLDSLLAKPIDRYSYTQTTAEYLQRTVEGRSTGYGYRLVFVDQALTTLRVILVEPQSPAALAGLRRGDTIVTIDGLNGAQIGAGLLASVTTANVPRTFVVRDTLGVPRSLNAVSADYALSPVNTSTVITMTNGTKVGYLMYQSFLGNAATTQALGAAINSFRSAGITELILDLRYNLGGSTQQSGNLSSMILGPSAAGKVFAQYRANDKSAAANFTQMFPTTLAATPTSTGLPAAPLTTLTRVFVLAGGSTASASEMLINGLAPHMTVITVGFPTYGKPFAFLPRDSSCGTVYSAVNYEVANSAGNANFANGISPTCKAYEDLNYAFGDPLESRTAAALSYIANGGCPLFVAEAPSSLSGAAAMPHDGSPQAFKNRAARDQLDFDVNKSETQRPAAILD
jgi:carboxyl-terminal processing protease